MNTALNNDRPIFLQVKEAIEDDILTGALPPGAQIPSNSQLVEAFQINPVTVLKATDQLAAAGLVHKRRGLGMFVSEEAPVLLREYYREQFAAQHIKPLVYRAKQLGITLNELYEMIKVKMEGREQ
jgi:DNA-binding transcriptional regulator YhcF (GntR family)